MGCIIIMVLILMILCIMLFVFKYEVEVNDIIYKIDFKVDLYLDELLI